MRKEPMVVREVARVMYGAGRGVPQINSIVDLRHLVEEGLPKETLRNTVSRILGPSEAKKFMNRVVPPATLSRRTKLTSEESARVERIARVIATAEHIIGEDAREFLTRPHPVLGSSPLELSTSELGARQVEDLLWRLYYGVAA
jgi:putative toxin-antitoxin system antitoxin component (TIGR02293 family)